MRFAALFLLFASLACQTARESPQLEAAALAETAPLSQPRLWSHAPAVDAQPAGVPLPPVPPASRGEAAGARDQSGELSRNASVTGRLPEAGQRASFPFFAEQGEQSLFEIAGYGYERGAAGRIRLSIEDSAGGVVWQSERETAVVWRDFSSFVAPSAGRWTYVIDVLQSGYRFVLVRHSDFPPLDATPIDIGRREKVHGHLAGPESVAKFLVPVSAGEELALKLTATRAEAQAEARKGATSMEAMSARMAAMSGAEDGAMAPGGMQAQPPMTERGAAGRGAQFQHFELEVAQDGVVLGPRGSYLRLRAPADGVLELRVRAKSSNGGGLFDIGIERALQLVRVHGVVVDSEDQPLTGVELHFLREPDGDPLAQARSDESGAFEVSLMPGRLAIQMMRGDRPARDAVRVQVDADAQIDLVYVPGSRARAR